MKREREGEVIFNLPNTLTTLRLLCIPLVVICLRNPGRLGSFLAALFFGLAFITDFLDGFFARRYGEITTLGKLLDPLADKILVCVTMVMLIPLDPPRIPAWIVMLIIAREIAVTGLRSIAVNRGVVIQASALGKYKTALQVTATIGLCLHYEYFKIDFHAVGMIFLWIALIFTLWSGWAYFRQFSKVFFPEKGKT
ncbi:MAG: CDP-diacylglycerol--glycerol-3-phosphate 3-phosphatidyltransferase [Deltaproteobacteria bacterium]|nr:MAG: CDP-diacylglycerol--glycerol-3-phosphate 3-phosphatidyltransferase [Deltaproteobacteria bacterium]